MMEVLRYPINKVEKSYLDAKTENIQKKIDLLGYCKNSNFCISNITIKQIMLNTQWILHSKELVYKEF